jgi:hypothetical protein
LRSRARTCGRVVEASPNTVVRPVTQGFSCPLGFSLKTVCFLVRPGRCRDCRGRSCPCR